MARSQSTTSKEVQIRKVFGPPGTGKTTRLLEIMETELESGVPASSLAYLSFTVAARVEAKHRAAVKFGASKRDLQWFRTLHSAAYQVLGIGRGALIDGTGVDLDDFGARFGYEFTGGRYTDEGLPVFGFSEGDRLLSLNHFQRHRLLEPRAAHAVSGDDYLSWYQVDRFQKAYAQWKAEDGRLDFTDLLERVPNEAVLPCSVVIIDEAQDLSPLQWRTLWRLARDARRVYIAGDDDQAIYEWAGASARALLDQPGETEVLPRSYRCPRAITRLANRVIQRVHDRFPKDWAPRDEEGGVSYFSWADQITVPEAGTVLWMARNHKYLLGARQKMQSDGMTYLDRGRHSVNPETAAAVIAWERLRAGRTVGKEAGEAVLRLAHHLQKRQRIREGLGLDDRLGPRDLEVDVSRPWFEGLTELSRDDRNYLRAVLTRAGGKAQVLTETPRVRLATIHGSKGAEADHVVLDTAISTAVLRGFERNPDPERRVWYVGLTRTRQTLALVGSDNPVLI